MLHIPCPWCGARAQSEFAYFGEAHILRPPHPDTLTDQQWADYLFFRANPKGWHHERWQHAAGCRRFFNMTRHTVTGVIHTAYRFDQPRPTPPQ